jgi:hypothetical protein
LVEEETLASLLDKASLAGTQPISDDALLRRLRSEATTWMNAVRMQRARLTPSRNRDLWEVEIDLHFLLVALVRLDRAVARAAGEVAALQPTLTDELESFRKALPGLRQMRDVGEHADEYNISKGRRTAVRRAEVQSWGMHTNSAGGLVWQWIGQELDVDAACVAATTLYNCFDAELEPVLGDSHRLPPQ